MSLSADHLFTQRLHTSEVLGGVSGFVSNKFYVYFLPMMLLLHWMGLLLQGIDLLVAQLLVLFKALLSL